MECFTFIQLIQTWAVQAYVLQLSRLPTPDNMQTETCGCVNDQQLH